MSTVLGQQRRLAMKRSVFGIAFGGLAVFALFTMAPSAALAYDGGSKAAAPRVFDSAPRAGTKATCPVMGGQFVVKADSERSTYKGKHVVFCCAGCKPRFDKNPEKFL